MMGPPLVRAQQSAADRDVRLVQPLTDRTRVMVQLVADGLEPGP